MDCFDFEEAALPPFDMDDLPPLDNSFDQFEDSSDLRPFLVDDSTRSGEQIQVRQWQTVILKMSNDCEVEAIRFNVESDDYPMYKAKYACTLCAQMGMDCYIASRGMLITGCTPCISLYRQCSHTHPNQAQGYVSTFPGIAEDEMVCHGPVTEQKKPLLSMGDSRGRKNGSRFPRGAVKILKQWLSEHNDHPYPNERERDELKELTGLKRSQINNWLANARRRGKVIPASATASPMLGAIDVPNAQSAPPYELMGPLDRWKCSPPEHEPAAMTAIAKAITANVDVQRGNTGTSLQNSRTSSRKASSEDESGMSMFRAPSTSSFDTKDSSNSDLSFASSRSRRSRTSFASSQDRRRRRRQPLTTRTRAPISAETTGNDKSKAKRIFQCTFCTDTFAAKYDWQRHEKSLHLALERWTCCPLGEARIHAVTGLKQCVFCQEFNTSDDHMETHNYTTCQEKTQQERTFYRKDHLRQHLKLVHGVKFDPHMETWKNTAFEVRSRCGFCPSHFISWQQRADHLAAHFKNGCDMSHWAGGHGFEPHVEKLVENAMPPYLIGHERTTLNPYIARARDGLMANGAGLSGDLNMVEYTEADQFTRDSNCWGRVENELINYVLEQRALGVVPTDKMLQDRARVSVYGVADEWDFTCADNQVWLEAFKLQQGVSTSEASTPEYSETRAVPMMAPYAVKGGLRSRKIVCANHMNVSEVRLSESSLAGVQEHARPKATGRSYVGTPITPDQPSSFDFHMAPVYDQTEMDIDFDSIDFSSLDLGAYGQAQDEGFNSLTMLPTTVPLATDAEHDFNNAGLMTSLNPQLSGKLSQFVQQQQQQQNQNHHEMTLEEFDQLTGYTSTF